MNILFINLTRDVDSPVRRAGWHPRHRLPPVSLGYCMSVASTMGHTAHLMDTRVDRVSHHDIVIKAREILPGLVLINPHQFAQASAQRLAGALKHACHAPVVALGGLTDMLPESVLDDKKSIDSAIIGEPEATLREIIQHISAGQDFTGVPGTCVRENGHIAFCSPRGLIGDIDALPFPRHDIFSQKKYTFLYPVALKERMRFAAVLTSRGCPFPCAHCSPAARVSHGTAYRTRSAGNVADELEQLTESGVNTVYFCDDNFTADRGRVLTLCAEIRRRNIAVAWAAQSRPDTLDRELLLSMKQAGCGCLNMGLEARSKRMLSYLNKYMPKKQIAAVVGEAHDLGIQINADIIVGIPGETPRDIKAALSFARRLNVSMITVLSFVPFPGSRLSTPENRSEAHGRSLYERHRSSSPPTDTERARKWFYLRYYLRLSFFQRYWKSCFSVRNISREWELLKSFFRYVCLQ